MVREYDTQLLESVAVRRRRLRDALLYGSLRHRRTVDENYTKVFIGLLIAAVLCAGSVGWSFLQHQRVLQQQQQQQQSSSGLPASAGAAAATPTGAADWRGKRVTTQLLQAGLRRAGIPDALYALPAVHEPKPGLESYYFLATPKSGQVEVGVFERGERRVGRSFTSDDQACRWMYDELVFPDSPPAKLPAGKAVAAKNATKAAVAQVRELVRPGAKAAPATAVATLPKSMLVDQFGQESGSYLYPDGTPFKERSLPPSTLSTTDRAFPYNYHRYQVVREFRVRAGVTAPAFGQPGGGVQFHAEPGLMSQAPELLTLRWLLRNGYLNRVAAD
jgi:hypothetical protein